MQHIKTKNEYLSGESCFAQLVPKGESCFPGSSVATNDYDNTIIKNRLKRDAVRDCFHCNFRGEARDYPLRKFPKDGHYEENISTPAPLNKTPTKKNAFESFFDRVIDNITKETPRQRISIRYIPGFMDKKWFAEAKQNLANRTATNSDENLDKQYKAKMNAIKYASTGLGQKPYCNADRNQSAARCRTGLRIDSFAYQNFLDNNDIEVPNALPYQPPRDGYCQWHADRYRSNYNLIQYTMGVCDEIWLKTLANMQVMYQLTKQRSAKKPSPIKANDTSNNSSSASTSENTNFEIRYSDLVIEDEIGRGGFGIVYKGKWRGVTVAIKQLPMLHPNIEEAYSFLNEAKMMANLRSPFTVQFYGITTTPHFNIIMEYMPKGSLYDLLHSSDSFSWSEKYQVAYSIAAGLSFLHTGSPQVLHRDLKSPNVLLKSKTEAKLTDFGLAKIKSTCTKTTTNSNNRVVGSVPWLAPELFSISPKYSTASDIYAMGMIFWEINSHELPFANIADPLLIGGFIQRGDRPRIANDTPQQFASLIKSCWATDPKDRCSADDAKANLEQFLLTSIRPS